VLAALRIRIQTAIKERSVVAGAAVDDPVAVAVP
jgi:hypothetical protein